MGLPVVGLRVGLLVGSDVGVFVGNLDGATVGLPVVGRCVGDGVAGTGEGVTTSDFNK